MMWKALLLIGRAGLTFGETLERAGCWRLSGWIVDRAASVIVIGQRMRRHAARRA